MLKIIFDLLCISVIIVSITDISDWSTTVKKALSFILTKGKIVKTDYSLHLVDCSFCQIFWCGLIYLLITNNFVLMNISLVCLTSCFAGIIKNTILLVEDSVTTIIKLIYKLIDKAL